MASRYPAPVKVTFPDGVKRGLFSVNPKVEKGAGQSYATYLLHLSPATKAKPAHQKLAVPYAGEAGEVGQRLGDVCPGRSVGCTMACLDLSGRGGKFTGIQEARRRRTLWALEDPHTFIDAVEQAIRRQLRSLKGLRLMPAIRLNGTSDIAWEEIAPVLFDVRFRGRPVPFYDYTKVFARLTKPRPDNYHLTYSWSDRRDADAEAREALALGYGVASAFRGWREAGEGESPHERVLRIGMDERLGVPVFDGDQTDLRFLDPRAHSIVLKAKRLTDPKRAGREAQSARAGFLRANPPDASDPQSDYEISQPVREG